DCKRFIETFQEIAEPQNREENEDASAAAVQLENLSVEGKSDAEKQVEEKSEDKTKQQESAAPEKESKDDSEKKVEEPASSA
ncbi:ran-binding protein 1 b-like, partial [Trifolium pratense]